jgi:hypothetical protein
MAAFGWSRRNEPFTVWTLKIVSWGVNTRRDPQNVQTPGESGAPRQFQRLTGVWVGGNVTVVS